MMESRREHMGKSPFEYTVDRDRFHKSLFEFHHSRGTPFLGLPTVSGKPLDLHLLYSLVTEHGGYHKVCDKNIWHKVDQTLLGFPEACANAELSLKQLYMRYLYLYERVYLHGEDPDQPDEEESVGQRTGTKSGGRILVHQVPLKYNYRQHRVDHQYRAGHGLSTSMVKPNRYERLEKSLLSGLPNEVDFAMNVCCLLSIEGPDTMRLLSRPNLLEQLLAHVGLFTNNSSLQMLYTTEWLPRSGSDFTRFWFDTLELDGLEYSPTILELISNEETQRQNKELYVTRKKTYVGDDMLHLSSRRPDKDVIYQRVLQVANILRNLSFDLPNKQAMGESELCFRFLLLCSHSDLPQIKRAGLDTLTNISIKYILPPAHESRTQLILRCINTWLFSKDKIEVINGLLLLVGLAQVEQNEDLISESLSSQIYGQIFSLARINDLQMIISALDALYFLSDLGEASCDAICTVAHAINFLIDFLTVETVSFGEEALGGIQVTDHGPPRGLMAPPPQRFVQMGPPTTPTPGPQRPQRPMAAPHRPPASTSPSPYKSIQPKPPLGVPPAPQLQRIQPKLPVAPASQLLPAQSVQPRPPAGGLLPATPQNLAVMNPEQVASNWLRANYELSVGSHVITATLHREYCTWLHRRSSDVPPCQPGVFVRCVKQVFPQSDLAVEGAESRIEGIRWRPPPGAKAPAAQTPPLCNSAASPRGPASPVQDGAASLRSMLTMATDIKAVPRPVMPQLGFPRRSSSETPASPKSPRAPELQICGKAERVVTVDENSAMARIERVENPRSPAAAESQVNGTRSIRAPLPAPLPAPEENSKASEADVDDLDKPVTVERRRSSNEDCWPKTNGDHARIKPLADVPIPNGLHNGDMSPNSNIAAAPLCNGHGNDSEDISKKLKRRRSGSGDACGGKRGRPRRNGFVNGVTDLKQQIEETREGAKRSNRHHSGDSLGSHASTSTLSSQSSLNTHQDDKAKTPTQPTTAAYIDQSRSRTNSTSSNHTTESADNKSVTYRCGWNGCLQQFASCSLLRGHVSSTHTSCEGCCMWAGCDQLSRKRWSLVSHVTERHTSDSALARSLNRAPSNTNPPAPAAIVSGQAAQLAILRNAPKPPYQDLMDLREGPVTKHIRFTSALILRNISRYSSPGRTLIKRHEAQLSYIAASSMEASSALLNALWELQQNHC